MKIRLLSRPYLVAAFGAAVLLVAPPAAAIAKRTPRKAAAKAKARRSPAPPSIPRDPDPDKVTLTTPDGVVLAATWRPVAGQPGAPAVLLLHDFSRDRREWDSRSRELNARGLATLALDLRGHGESTRKTTGAVVSPSPRMLHDAGSFPRDLAAACDWLKARSRAVGVMGLSAGANLAVIAAAQGRAAAAVAVSANVKPLSDLAGGVVPVPRATLVLASEQDPGRAASARALYAAGQEPKKVEILPGAAHNMALFVERPEAWAAAVDWLATSLKAVPATTIGPGPPDAPVIGPGRSEPPTSPAEASPAAKPPAGR